MAEDPGVHDLFGRALLNCYRSVNSRIVIARDDQKEVRYSLGPYFTGPDGWPVCERKLIKGYAKEGPALDVGGGAGRISIWLQEHGIPVCAIDNSEGACEVMRKRKVMEVHHMDARALKLGGRTFKTVLLIGGLGLAGTWEGTRELLVSLSEVSARGAKLITTSRDPFETDDAEHLAYHKQNISAGLHPGQVRFRVWHNYQISKLFTVLLVPIAQLDPLVKGTGWKRLSSILVEPDDSYYGVVFERE